MSDIEAMLLLLVSGSLVTFIVAMGWLMGKCLP